MSQKTPLMNDIFLSLKYISCQLALLCCQVFVILMFNVCENMTNDIK